jgi:EAL domain-containing protein (putative c-di-GMP-specific phosphodiesterase class I)
MLRGIGVDYAQGYGVDRPQELFKATDYPDVSSSVE